MDLKTIKQDLLLNPLFHFSLGSKELFHTNFWNWLSTIDPMATARLFLPSIKDGQKCTFTREESKGSKKGQKAQVDLALYVDDKKVLVIENKTKDVIKQDQIDRIESNHAADGTVKFLLVTLFDYFVKLSSDWSVLRYKELADRIVVADFKVAAYEKQTIEKYKALLLSLDSLQRNLPKTDKYDFTENGNKELFDLLDEIKFWESYVKMRGALFAQRYSLSRSNKVDTYVSLNRKKVTVDFFYALPRQGRIGVQVEDGRLCKFINKAENKTNFHEEMARQELYFSDSYLTPRKKKFGTFKPDFFYQYSKIETGLTEEAVFTLIDEYTESISKHMSSILTLVQ